MLLTLPGIAAADGVPQGAANPPAGSAAASCGTLSNGASGAAVATVQAAIGTTADGGFGPKTEAALKRWQRKHKIKATGQVDRATWAALPEKVSWAACGQRVTIAESAGKKHCSILSQGDAGPAVAVLQKGLGVDVDGGFGPVTAKAVKAAQRKAKLKPSGATTYKLWRALRLTATPACQFGPAPSGSSGGNHGGNSDAKRQARIRGRVDKIVDGLDGPAATSSPIAQQALGFAHKQIGKPYLYGGTGPKRYDCSGLAMASFDAAAVSMPRTAAQQYGAGPHIPLQNVQQGDLLYWASDVTKPSTVYHTGIYVGNGKVLDAPHTGTDVQIQQLWSTDLLPNVVRPVNELDLPAKRGDEGTTVADLQTALDHHGFKLSVDGAYGPDTVSAVKSWQSKKKLSVTGRVTTTTWLTLGWKP